VDRLQRSQESLPAPRTRYLLAVSAILAALVVSPAAARLAGQPATVPARPGATLAQPLLERINAVRRAHNLTALHFNPRLSRAALAHAHAMAQLGFFSHSSSDGTPASARIRQYYPSSTVGETLLWRSPTASAGQALAMWMNSPPHRRVLLSRSFDEVGIGTVHVGFAPGAFGGRPVTIVVADFGTR
jgi:uncharacterized protein YkwD